MEDQDAELGKSVASLKSSRHSFHSRQTITAGTFKERREEAVSPAINSESSQEERESQLDNLRLIRALRLFVWQRK